MSIRYYSLSLFALLTAIPHLAAQTPAAAPVATPIHAATAPLIKPNFGNGRSLAPTETYYRVLCVVPIVGTGTRRDPFRPEYAPVHKRGDAYHSGIIAWTQIPADDGKHAIVEFVATSQAALQPILNDKRLDVVVFQRGVHSKQQTEAGIQKYRKDFSLDSFPRAVAQ